MNACKEMSKVEWEEVRLYIPGWNLMEGGGTLLLWEEFCALAGGGKAGNGMAGYMS